MHYCLSLFLVPTSAISASAFFSAAATSTSSCLATFCVDGFSLRLFSLHFGSFECFSFCRCFGFGLHLGFSLFGNLGEFFLLLCSSASAIAAKRACSATSSACFALRSASSFAFKVASASSWHFGLSPALFGFLDIKLGSFVDFLFFGRFGVVLDGARLDGVNRFVRFGDHSAGVLDSHDDE